MGVIETWHGSYPINVLTDWWVGQILGEGIQTGLNGKSIRGSKRYNEYRYLMINLPSVYSMALLIP